MGDFLSKIESFLFDLLGLALPGAIFLLILISPVCFLDFSSISAKVTMSSFVLSGLLYASNLIKTHFSLNPTLLFVSFIVLAYIVGHVVKVFSIVVYEFLTALFDKTINEIVSYLFEALKNLGNRINNAIFKRDMYDSWLFPKMKVLFIPIKNTVQKAFVFKSPDYFADNEPMRTKCVELINKRLNTTYPDKWYSLYKFSTVLHSQEDIKSLSSHFLAKYNLYRSLSFLFMFTAVYFYWLCQLPNNYFSNTEIIFPIVCTICFLWFTFHYKFKRYWTLCGNETLVSLFYFLNKKDVNES
jgi:hypothetical protein